MKYKQRKNNQISKKVKYNSIKNDEIGRNIKKLTKDIKNYLFDDETSLLYNSRDNINKDLENLNKYFSILNKNNNVYEVISDNSIVSKKNEYIDKKMAMTVKDKKNNDDITIEDLIQEIVCQNINENNFNDKKRRKYVLDNYFKGTNSMTKFPNKYKMEKALKNINYEMEKASEEFSKLL